MQPYLFPYIGYFQMIHSVDAFVFYDDVNYINRGWVNRNRILINGDANYFTVPLLNASQNKLINEIEINYTAKEYKNLTKTIEMAYKKAPYFSVVYPLVSEIIVGQYKSLAEIAIHSIKECSQYLGLQSKFYVSSQDFSNTRGMEKAERLQSICKKTRSN